MKPILEVRDIPGGEIEVREEGSKSLKGYAAVFNSLSYNLGYYRERIMPGAFRSTLDRDILALADHDNTKVLGRTSANTLKLREDDKGLSFELDVIDTTYGRDVLELVRTRHVRGMSFGFYVRDAKWLKENGENVREITNLDLIEISVVTFPAYPATEVSLRSAEHVWQNRPAESEDLDYRKLLLALAEKKMRL